MRSSRARPRESEPPRRWPWRARAPGCWSWTSTRARAKQTVERIERIGGQATTAPRRRHPRRRQPGHRRAGRHALGAGSTSLRQRRSAAVEDRRRGRRGEDLRPDHGGERQGVYLGAKYALPVMKRQRRGVFLITASTPGHSPAARAARCTPPQGAVVALAKALALETRAARRARGGTSRRWLTRTPMLPTLREQDRGRRGEAWPAASPPCRARAPERAGGRRLHRRCFSPPTTRR